MNEIYWITRLDGICVFLNIIAVFSSMSTVVLFFIVLIKRSDADIHPEGSAPCKLHIDIYNKYL